MTSHTFKRIVLIAAVSAAALAPASVRACEGDGCLTTPEECATGSANGVTLGSEAGRFAVCVAGADHTVLYAGGDPLGPCGAIVVADQTVVGHPDPNQCPLRSDPMPGSTWHEEWFPSADGTPLHADVYRPAGLDPAAETPVILMVTPYANTGGTGDIGVGADLTPTGGSTSTSVRIVTAGIVPDIFERGYTLVVVSLRGFGASGGCDDFGGAGSQSDVKAAVEWSASRAWSTGRVGMWGQSADGWTQVMALATDPEGLAAVVIQQPPIDRYAQAFMNGVPYWAAASGSALRYGQIDSIPPSVFASPQHFEQWATGGTKTAGGCFASNVAGHLSTDPADPFWTERDLTARAARSDVPVFLANGFLDSNVRPGAFLDLWTGLSGPKRAWFAQVEHTLFDGPDNPDPPDHLIGRDTFKEEALRWLDTYVRQLPADETGIDQDPAVTVERNDGTWRAEATWPPAGAERQLHLLAGSYEDLPGNSAEAPDPSRRCPGSFGGVTGCPRVRNGVGTWTFGTPLSAPVHIAGAPRLTVHTETLVPNATLIALMYDLDPQGTATLLTRGATLLRTAGEATVSFDLYPQDWIVGAGHRIGVLLTGSDMGWFAPAHTATTVGVRDGSLAVPVLSEVHDATLDGFLSFAGTQRAPFAVDPATIEARTAPF